MHISSGSTLFAKKNYLITCDPLIYTMDHPKLILSKEKEESSSI